MKKVPKTKYEQNLKILRMTHSKYLKILYKSR